MILTKYSFLFLLLCLAAPGLFGGQAPAVTAQRPQDTMDYVLGPGDSLKVWALGLEEISNNPIRIGPDGDIDLPVLGRIRAAGLTVNQFTGKLIERASSQVREPKVSVDIVEFGSQPVSVLGAVNRPGVYQLQGRKTLAEMLSLAGGLRPDAGSHIKITRLSEWGDIPVRNARTDPSGKISVAQVPVTELMSGNDAANNVLVRPHDVITVSQAEMIYVIGAVKKPGGIVLNEKEHLSVLQVLSMAEGLGNAPAPQNTKILRPVPGSGERQEIPIDLKKILQGKGEDITLRANDILFVPDSTPKKAASRALEAAIQTATGVIIWRRP